MPDDLDDLIRAAMKTLDEQVPSGYFEALPNQTLARLEGSMQHGSQGTTTEKGARPPVSASQSGPAVSAAPQRQASEDQTDRTERDEDSGLHDIRNLAASQRMRMSSKRVSTSPPQMEDDSLSSTSGSFKNIALPQPAKMVSLPELAELPAKHEVIARDKRPSKAEVKAAKAEAKAEAKAAVDIAQAPIAAPATSSRFTLPSQQRRSKGPLIAVLGLGVAAAAGGLIFMQMNKEESKSASVVDQTASAPAAKAEVAATPTTTTATGAAAGSAAAPEPAPPPAEEPAKPADTAMQIAAPDEGKANTDENAEKDKAVSKAGPKTKATPTKGKGGKKGIEKEQPPEVKPEVKPEKPVEKAETTKKPTGGKGDGEDFDALLKEAGVQEKQQAKPKLDKKSLTGDDFKHGMASVEGKAKACYKGTQGNVMLKLTVSPDGKVAKSSVSGEFAGKPEATCVQSAVKAATFPPWDGGPMSFNYAVLLSD